MSVWHNVGAQDTDTTAARFLSAAD